MVQPEPKECKVFNIHCYCFFFMYICLMLMLNAASVLMNAETLSERGPELEPETRCGICI